MNSGSANELPFQVCSAGLEKGGHDAEYGGSMSTRNRYLVLVVLMIVSGFLSDHLSSGAQLTPAVRQAVAPTGRLRVGVYPGSPTSLIRSEVPGEEKGLTVDLGREFARRLGIPAELVEFGQIQDVLAALRQGQVDFTVTNATPARAKDVDFSDPILGVELGYLVPANSSISTLADVDKPGIRVGVTAGSSSQGTLSGLFKNASLVPAATLQVAVTMLGGGKIDAYATNKAILFEMSDQLPGSRVIDGRWGIESFAVAIPKGRDQALAPVRMFADAVKSEGLVKRAADRAGMRGTINAQ
jgi:polar amino acid transport system substrate-binding protein